MAAILDSCHNLHLRNFTQQNIRELCERAPRLCTPLQNTQPSHQRRVVSLRPSVRLSGRLAPDTPQLDLLLVLGLELDLGLELLVLELGLRSGLVELDVAVAPLLLGGGVLCLAVRTVLDVGEPAAERGGQHGGRVQRVGRPRGHTERGAARGSEVTRQPGSEDRQTQLWCGTGP